jgi:hypothetical protein
MKSRISLALSAGPISFDVLGVPSKDAFTSVRPRLVKLLRDQSWSPFDSGQICGIAGFTRLAFPSPRENADREDDFSAVADKQANWLLFTLANV